MHEKITDYKELRVWQKARVLANRIYCVTDQFPQQEKFALAQQMRRAAISIISNLAEGSQRGGRKEFLHFVTISRGSTAELESQLIIACDQQFINSEDTADLLELIKDVSRMQMRLIQALKREAISETT